MQNGNMKSLLKSVYDLSFILICWLAMEATSAAALPLLIKRALHLPLTLTPFQHSKHILLQLAKPPSPSSDVIWYVVSTFFAFIELFAFPEFVVFMIKSTTKYLGGVWGGNPPNPPSCNDRFYNDQHNNNTTTNKTNHDNDKKKTVFVRRPVFRTTVRGLM